MAKRSATSKQQLSKKLEKQEDVSVSTATTAATDSTASQPLRPVQPNASGTSTSSLMVIAACLFLAGAEIYQLYELLLARDYALTPEFWDDSWEIVKKNWQSKLLAIMFFLKSFYTYNQPQAPTQRAAWTDVGGYALVHKGGKMNGKEYY